MTAPRRELDIAPYLPLSGPSLPGGPAAPWSLVAALPSLVEEAVKVRSRGAYRVRDGLCIHDSAVIEDGAVLKPPLLVEAGCFIAAHAYLRGGCWLERDVRVGPGVEVKTSYLGRETRLAHFNFVGDSVIGADVNLEAGAVIANRFNERADDAIVVFDGKHLIATGATRFGALVGDGCRIGANAVIAPGSLVPARTVVGRLALYERSPRTAGRPLSRPGPRS